MVEEDVIEQGRIAVPEKPGLGVTLNPDAIQPHIADGDTLFDDG
jgi:L-alanine-DL-glutamate epimerase-like enolase superfamily enzyme